MFDLLIHNVWLPVSHLVSAVAAVVISQLTASSSAS